MSLIHAACHCGAIHLELAERPESVSECNCSICRRYATLWAYYPSRSVQVTADSAVLEKYVWGDGSIAFVRCAHCGCVMYWERVVATGDDAQRMGINARMFEPADLSDVPLRKLDGANTWKYQD